MGYIGENRQFSFRDGCCETLPGAVLGTAGASELGRVCAGQFRRFCVGCAGFSHTRLLYAVCCGIAEAGRDVFVCENTDMPSFRFGLGLLGADCGIYVSGGVRLSFFEGNGFPAGRERMSAIMNGDPAQICERSGKIAAATSFREIYVNNVADRAGAGSEPVKAGVSCGSRSVRALWSEFFSGGEDIVFQVSDDGSRVNAYSVMHGFISHERLIMAYSRLLQTRGETVYLPDDMHYAADGGQCVRFDMNGEIPRGAVEQRFLIDPLFMCVELTSDMKRFDAVLRSLPAAATVRREVTVGDFSKLTLGEDIPAQGGRVRISRSGKNRVTLAAQAFSSETAAELCAEWTEKIRRMGM